MTIKVPHVRKSAAIVYQVRQWTSPELSSWLELGRGGVNVGMMKGYTNGKV